MDEYERLKQQKDAMIADLKRKGGDLCNAYANALIKIHDLETCLADARQTVARQAVTIGEYQTALRAKNFEASTMQSNEVNHWVEVCDGLRDELHDIKAQCDQLRQANATIPSLEERVAKHELSEAEAWAKYRELKAPYIQDVLEVPFGTVRKQRCHAQQDGDCEWSECPQLRDDEPKKSGRHCPLDAYMEKGN